MFRVLSKECYSIREKQPKKAETLSNVGLYKWNLVQQTPFEQLVIEKI
jgi:hypothetical protein